MRIVVVIAALAITVAGCGGSDSVDEPQRDGKQEYATAQTLVDDWVDAGASSCPTSRDLDPAYASDQLRCGDINNLIVFSVYDTPTDLNAQRNLFADREASVTQQAVFGENWSVACSKTRVISCVEAQKLLGGDLLF
ncbi:hypothetical protein JGU71_28100 [Antrihabitans sp. YC3-6]|uniref:Uncharacterized protein n=1 Tax=Antrihabitans stalagmiti TaxID=2799499 RepID=A0A934NWW9_9NOCA|nr:hypothetical protein [Antrihabitans stalagmiti]MBJ8342758.1 hypothetical protein [Antrihabitans stalagmiti]